MKLIQTKTIKKIKALFSSKHRQTLSKRGNSNMEREITNPKLQIPNKHQIQNYKLAKVFNFENWNLLLGICNFKTTTLALTFSLLIFLILPTQTHASSEMDLSMFVMDKETNQPLEGTHTLVFTIYPEDSNSSVWQESQEIELNYGLIKTSLGKNESLPTDLDPLNNNYFLGIKIGDDIELTPRKKISPNPFSISSIYSQTSGDSQTLEGSQIGEEEGDIMLLGSG